MKISIGINIILLIVILFMWCRILKYRITLEQEREERRKEKLELRQRMIHLFRPHFVFNMLAVMRYMIKKNPEKAYNMVYDFSKYLRGNVESLTEEELIPVDQELEHVKAYLNMEQIHLGERLNVVYQIDRDDFQVPRRCIELLVENAVKHGISRKLRGGTIWIRTRRTEKGFRIEVEDDGVGFEPEKLDESKTRGFRHIRNSLRAIPGSEMGMESQPEQGAKVWLQIGLI
jgi:LytS/YehU family sensor histidine kinase